MYLQIYLSVEEPFSRPLSRFASRNTRSALLKSPEPIAVQRAAQTTQLNEIAWNCARVCSLENLGKFGTAKPVSERRHLFFSK